MRYAIVVLLSIFSSVAVMAEKKHVPTDAQGRELPANFTPPKYKDGREDIVFYLQSNLKYPREHAINGEGGRVVVRFKINKKGEVQDPVVVKSASPLMDEEALRVVGMMDDWQPGLNAKGEPIVIRNFLPVTFRFKDRDTEFLEPAMQYMDIGSKLGSKLDQSYFIYKVGEPFETERKKVKGERIRSFYYYDRGDDVLKISKTRGLFYCSVESPRFFLLDAI